MIGQPVFSAILKEPLWNGSKDNSSPLFLVPSGKIQIDTPPTTRRNRKER